MDLPLVLGLNDEKDYGRFPPYLKPNPKRVEFWREKLSKLKGFKIGISWQGSREYSVDRIRSFPLSAFLPLARLEGIHLIALQRGEGEEQLAGYREQLPLVLPGPGFDTEGGAFSDTAAVAQSLDLVIASDSSLAHVTGRARHSHMAHPWLPVRLAISPRPRGQSLVSGHAAHLPFAPNLPVDRGLRPRCRRASRQTP